MATTELDVQWEDFLPLSQKDDLEKRLLAILSLTKYLGLSFSELLFFMFSSKHPKIRLRAAHFLSYHSENAVPFPAKHLFDLWHQFPSAIPHLHREIITPCAHEVALAESNTLMGDKSLRIKVANCTLKNLKDALDPFHLIHKFRAGSPFLFGILMTYAAGPTQSSKCRDKRNRAEDEILDEEHEENVLLDDSGRPEEGLEDEARAEHAQLFDSFSAWSNEFPHFNVRALITIVVIFSMLLFTRNRGINILSLPLALFMRLGGADRRTMSVLNNMGICSSYWTVERLKEAITKDAVQLAVDWMASGKAWYIIFDNLNIYLRKFEQRLTNKNAMLNITNVAIIGQPDVDPEAAFDLGKLLALRGKRGQAKGAEIVITLEDSEYMERAMIGVVAQMLVAYCPGSTSWPDHAMTRKRAEGLTPFERPLPPRKTETFPFGVFDVNEGSKKGVIDVVKAIHSKSKLSEEEWSSKVRIAEGDWLTSNNLRGAKRERSDDVSIFEQLSNVKELSAKWHFALNYLHLLMKVHFGNAIDDPGSLASHKGLLGRTWDVNKPNYAAAKSLVRHSLIARLLNIVMQIKGYTQYSDLLKWKPTFEDLHKISTRIVKEFATSLAGSKAQESGDDWLAHSSYFIRDTLLFVVFENYVSFADAGGVLRVIKFWSFSFRGAGMWNYARECLEILLLWNHELTPELRDALEKGWFINRTGFPGRWIPADLWLEHLNFWVKRAYIAQGSGVTVDYMTKKGSACVEAFRDIIHKVVRFTGNKDVSRRHKESRFHLDVRMLVENMQKRHLHKLSNEPRLVPARSGKRKTAEASTPQSAIADVMEIGAESLQNGGFWDFLMQTTFDPALGWPLDESTRFRRDIFKTGSPFDNPDKNPLAFDEQQDIDVGDEEETICPGAGGLGGGSDFD